MSLDLPKRVVVLGSGALKIGEAGEFDYSGSQCLKALEEEGVYAVVVNPNIATLQTDPPRVGRTYFQPVTPEFVEPILESEGADAILLSFGGQTALNCGVALHQRGVLRRLGVKVLGTPVRGIEETEDRALFLKLMEKASVPVLKSHPVYSVEEALTRAKQIGYPVIVRVAFTLGGKGGGVARDAQELREVASRGLRASPVSQVLLERYVGSFKQIEYEVVRDRLGNSLTVCNMENVLGMRVHTGDNIVVAPSQTLTDSEYQLLRAAAIRAADACGIIGECNIQFALDPRNEEYYAIEINARLSRSSALASKATGYPLAYVAAKLALGYTLPELKNRVTGVTTACFEPALDYVVVKHPRWDMEKFPRARKELGPTMKSVGEVMGIGATFPEALLKAVRMTDPRSELVPPEHPRKKEEVLSDLANPSPQVLWHVLEAFDVGIPDEKISAVSWIDPWFVAQLREVHGVVDELRRAKGRLPAMPLLRRAKRLGLSDRAVARSVNRDEEEVRQARIGGGIVPHIRMIDTLANEWPARTNYLYLTYGADSDEVGPSPKGSVLVLGAGPYRIGSSVEFDWSTMNLVDGLKAEGVPSVAVLNSNPETVSTDYDRSDRLYFEEITLERIRDIYDKERFRGVVTCVGSQLAQNVTPLLATCGIPILGTSSDSIDAAEDRSRFSRLLERLGIPQPAWRAFTTFEEAERFADEVGYPVLVRPSYVLSGAAMRVIPGKVDLERFLSAAVRISPEHPVVISKFLEGAGEIDLDAVGDGENILVAGILEHVERAGVHSGDAILVLPPRSTPPSVQEKMVKAATAMARALSIKGPFNVQFLVVGEDVYVIELNLRASRSLPFVSKGTGTPVLREAARAFLGKGLSRSGMSTVPFGRWGVKVPQFSFFQVEGADPLLGVEMQSTGEVACFGPTFPDALVKAMVATGVKFVAEGGRAFLSVGGPRLKEQLLPAARLLERLGFELMATEDTAAYLLGQGIQRVRVLYKIMEPDREPNLRTVLERGEVDLILNVPASFTQEKFERMLEDEYVLRRRAIELAIPLFTSVETFTAYVGGLAWLREHPLTVEALYGSDVPREGGTALAWNQPRSVSLLRASQRPPSRRSRR
ncbi:MAG: carbamoyl-phosphate synthase (glutamine-hydrolyzing) large subunit [Euryarchaeota archaeon]|nr:carbamoyl-phosphate synthase (glutamine-hydrolyzing) large subunit [Euryarchaeota archaeon]MDE1835529.1 carbamoyl-phosphate synthase (glutamine-hydrolyzing) large subunit [Euryarchaeota archaeon]MDE1879620.1 carbamoyl-phosphate synthase (glutamine-hydrolyzing) large subunit [Euryarchaeota archaeon]MDE2043849.1 carbamoyl-phosphate synthase (glutamine-hydrolyzing) large subunit [Thermoplasmata archaeon]